MPDKEKEEERRRILGALEEMERSEGWRIVKEWLSAECQNAYTRLYREGLAAHERNVGFLDGLVWIINQIETFKNKK